MRRCLTWSAFWRGVLLAVNVGAAGYIFLVGVRSQDPVMWGACALSAGICAATAANILRGKL